MQQPEPLLDLGGSVIFHLPVNGLLCIRNFKNLLRPTQLELFSCYSEQSFISLLYVDDGYLKKIIGVQPLLTNPFSFGINFVDLGAISFLICSGR